jgi:hypothetical protein
MQRSGRSGQLARRTVLLGGALSGLLVGRGVAAAAPPSDLAFAIFRKGERIGTHDVTFRAAGGGLAVRHAIDIVVKLAFIPIFRFHQEAEDLWRDGRLVAADCDTDDNGQRGFVRVRERGSRLLCEGPRGPREAPLGTMTDLSYWNQAIVGQRGVIDLMKGEVEPLALAGGEPETIEVGGRPVAARRWRMNPQGQRGGEVWYDAAGRLVHAVVRTRGEVLDYRLLV